MWLSAPEPGQPRLFEHFEDGEPIVTVLVLEEGTHRVDDTDPESWEGTVPARVLLGRDGKLLAIELLGARLDEAGHVIPDYGYIQK